MQVDGVLVPAANTVAPSASRSATPASASFSAALASSIAASGSENSNSSGQDAGVKTPRTADSSAEPEVGSRSDSNDALKAGSDGAGATVYGGMRPSSASANLPKLAVKTAGKSDTRPSTKTVSSSPAGVGAASVGATPVSTELPANMTVGTMYTAATLASVAQVADSPTGSTSTTNVGNGGSDPQSNAIGIAANGKDAVAEARSPSPQASAQSGTVATAAAQSTISHFSFSPDNFVTPESSISSNPSNGNELSSQPSSPASWPADGAVDGGFATATPSGTSVEPSFSTGLEAISSQTTSGLLDTVSAQATVKGNGAQSSSSVPASSSVQASELTASSFANLPAPDATDGAAPDQASRPSGTVSVASSGSGEATPPQTITATGVSKVQTTTPASNAANSAAPQSIRDTNATIIQAQAPQTTAASFEPLSQSGTLPSSDGQNQDEATTQRVDAQPAPASIVQDFPAVGAPRVESIVSSSGSDGVVAAAPKTDSSPSVGTLPDAQVQPSVTTPGPASATRSVAGQEHANGGASIATPVIPGLETPSVMTGLSKDAGISTGKSNSTSTGALGGSDTGAVHATIRVTADVTNDTATKAVTSENSPPRDNFATGNSGGSGASTSATVPSTNVPDKTGKKSSPASPTVSVGNGISSSLPSSGDAAAASVSPASASGKDAPAAQTVPAAPAPIETAQATSAGPAELPKSHQMLDSPTATPPSQGTSSASSPVGDAETSSQMHVGIRTDAFGAVEIHTVVQHSQIGLTVHGERDIARWFTSEVPGLEAGLNKSHLNLTGVDFQSASQTSAGFQQGQSRQSFSQPQNSSLGNAGDTLPEKETTAENVPADILPSDVIRGESQTHVSIHV
jgi:hypothetical protein